MSIVCKVCFMLEADQTVETTGYFFVREDVLVKQSENVVQVSSTELENSLLNACNEASVDDVAVGQETTVLDLSGEDVATGEVLAAGSRVTPAPIRNKAMKMRTVQRRLKSVNLL